MRVIIAHLRRADCPQENKRVDAIVPVPPLTPFDVAAAIVSAILYAVVALAAFATAPRDVRVRVFLVIALTSIVPYLAPVLTAPRGGAPQFSRAAVMALGLATTVGACALFHFSQVFPWRRAWLRRHATWLLAAYIVAPLAAGGLIGLAPATLDEVSAPFLVTALLVGLPLLILITIVLPLAGLVSLYKSWVAARDRDMTSARAPTFGVLVSQLAGGVLAIVIIPLLSIALPSGRWVAIATALLFLFGLMMPLAFAAAVWKYQTLQLDVEGLTDLLNSAA